MNKKFVVSTVTIAFATLLLCSVYTTISTVSVITNWGDFRSFTNAHEGDGLVQSFPTVTKHSQLGINDTGPMRNSEPYNDSVIDPADHSLYSKSNDQRSPLPIIIQTLKKLHPSKLFNGTTIISNSNSTNTLQREQRRVLEVLVEHYSRTHNSIDSDVVELGHCRLELIDYSKFSSWSSVILHDAWPKIEQKLKRNSEEVKDLRTRDVWDADMYREFCFGLLEMFATHSNEEEKGAICDFKKYSLKFRRGHNIQSAGSTLRNVPPSGNGLPRLVFVIIAFQDGDHLEALIEACFMPHHLIIIHLEHRSPTPFTERIHRIATRYDNVAVVQFGSIIYQTDSVSTINYQIMHWVTEELKIPYDYWLTLGNAAYPLLGASELTNYFRKTKRNIWLGELRNNNNGGRVSWAYLERKRLIFTTGVQKYTQRTKKWKQNGFEATIPDYIKTNMTEKTNSGNQAVFSHQVVKKLIDSPQVKELFSIAKYGCCCCLEERTWIAAARMIGYGSEAMDAASMFQVWGGESECGRGSMKNALLKPNATICYKSEDLTKGNIYERHQNDSGRTDDPSHSFFHGDNLLSELQLAKTRGFLFARKFKSGDRDSVKLIEMIKKNLHDV